MMVYLGERVRVIQVEEVSIDSRYKRIVYSGKMSSIWSS